MKKEIDDKWEMRKKKRVVTQNIIVINEINEANKKIFKKKMNEFH